jgi:hypothetical protein
MELTTYSPDRYLPDEPKARQELGDSLTKLTGKGSREPGRVAQQ